VKVLDKLDKTLSSQSAETNDGDPGGGPVDEELEAAPEGVDDELAVVLG
jgi:hypothetical protein